MENRDAEETVGVNVGMERDWCEELEGGWKERIVGWESEVAAEVSSWA